MNNFTEILNRISDDFVNNYASRITRTNFDDCLDQAIVMWCEHLNLEKEEYDFICQGYKTFPQLKNVIIYLWDQYDGLDWLSRRRTNNEFFNKINNLLLSIKTPDRGATNIKIFLLFAFVITAAGYCVYRLNLPQNKNNVKNPKIDDYSFSIYNVGAPASYSDGRSNVKKSHPEKSIKKEFLKCLILVVSANNNSLIDSIKNKKNIDSFDCDELYEATQYLCQDNENKLSEQWKNVQKFTITEESEYDIYLINIELKKADQGFEKNVNQLDRYDAFRKLSELATNKIEVSPRLSMQASIEFDVYIR